LLGPSTVFCVAVVACTVVMRPSLMPNLSFTTWGLGGGARARGVGVGNGKGFRTGLLSSSHQCVGAGEQTAQGEKTTGWEQHKGGARQQVILCRCVMKYPPSNAIQPKVPSNSPTQTFPPASPWREVPGSWWCMMRSRPRCPPSGHTCPR
jgi:hypothetical protein